MRFFKSGYQTVADIVRLASDIRNGKHPMIPRTRNINIFAYSIGAFLAEIIMMGNPDNLFSDSKLFIFCGGSVFSNMKGASKFIMDKRAFDRVYNYYLYDFEKTITGRGPLTEFPQFQSVRNGFQVNDRPWKIQDLQGEYVKKTAGTDPHNNTCQRYDNPCQRSGCHSYLSSITGKT